MVRIGWVRTSHAVIRERAWVMNGKETERRGEQDIGVEKKKR